MTRELERMRKAKGLSQRGLAGAAKVDTPFICTCERYGFGKGVRLKRLADYLGWSGDPEGLLEELPEEVSA